MSPDRGRFSGERSIIGQDSRSSRALNTRCAADGTLLIEWPPQLRDAFAAMAKAQGITIEQLMERMLSRMVENRDGGDRER